MTVKWAKVIDQRKCIGCHACTIACKSEHDVPIGVSRTFVKQLQTGTYPSVQRHFQVTRCNQCEYAPCVTSCPTGAMFKREDGIVDFNRDTCIGCKACIAACPYDAIYIDPDTHSAEKCNFCSHRIDVGLLPACVVVCPTQSIIVGDMNDPKSQVSKILLDEKTEVRRPEKNTNPKLFYLGLNKEILKPSLFGESSSTGYMASNSRKGYNTPNGEVQARDPKQSSAATIIEYRSQAKPMWDWPISGYTWAKSLSTGTFIVAALSIFMGKLDGSLAWDLYTGVISTIFLFITGLFLMLDLSHPERFYLIFIRPQWNSWIARGTFLIMFFGISLILFMIFRFLDSPGITFILRWTTVILGLLTSIYTAFLFGQAKGRDLWQNRLLPIHFLVEPIVAGCAVLILLGWVIPITFTEITWLRWVFVGSSIANLALILIDLVNSHKDDNNHNVLRNLVYGKWGKYYWAAIIFSLISIGLIIISSGLSLLLVGASIGSLIGLFAYWHAFVGAGQSMPQT